MQHLQAISPHVQQLHCAELRNLDRMHIPSHTTRWPSCIADTAAWILHPLSHHISHVASMRPHLPKGSLADSWRAEDLRHLPTHIAAGNIVTRKARWTEDLVELGDACRYSAGPAGVESMQCLRRGNGRESVCCSLSVYGETPLRWPLHTRRG